MEVGADPHQYLCLAPSCFHSQLLAAIRIVLLRYYFSSTVTDPSEPKTIPFV